MSTRVEEFRTMIARWRAAAALATIALAAPLGAWAQNAIQSITSTQQAGTEVVRVELSEPLAAVPNGFSTQQPPRIAIDLPGVANATGRSSIEINQGNLRSASVAVAGDRTRLVLNLKQASSYRAQLQGKALLVVLDGSSGPAVAAAPAGAADAPVHFAPSQNTAPQGLRDIDFRRGADGAGRIVVSLPSTQVGVASRGSRWWSSSCARRCRRTCAAGSTSPTSARRSAPCPRSRAAIACAWSSSRAAPGSTAPTRPTTSSCSRCARSRSTRTS
jgi:type IV pilus assembly protein PilQ